LFALAHRFEPGAVYMAMTAYFDESGTHGESSPAVIVAGFGATVAQWNGCEKRLKKLFADYGIQRFHAKEWRQTKGEFRGWDFQKKGHFLSRLLKITDEQMSFGVAGVMHPVDYQKYYRDQPFPRGVRPDTAYGICFRTALVRSFLDCGDRPEDWPLNVVLELGHPNWQDKKDVRYEKWLGVISFATKSDCLFLGLADSLAYALFRDAAGYSQKLADPRAAPLGPAYPPYYVTKPRLSRTLLDQRGLTALHRIHSSTSLRRRP
jgi:hypothetical protein